MVAIRVGRLDEIAALQHLESRAASRFAEAGYPAIAALPVVDAKMHTTAIAREELFVIEDGAPGIVSSLGAAPRGYAPLGFALVETVADAVHLWELDVDVAAAGRGLGGRLLDHVAAHAVRRGAPRVTLTTFRDVPFNAPYYARRGFHILDEPLPARLAAIRQHERAVGIELLPRVAMARAV